MATQWSLLAVVTQHGAMAGVMWVRDRDNNWELGGGGLVGPGLGMVIHTPQESQDSGRVGIIQE